MQNLRDQLLKAGIITEDEHKSGSTAKEEKKGKPRSKDKENKDKDKVRRRAKESSGVPSVDVSDPKILRIMQAIEQHRLRDDTRGEAVFHFALRDGRVRKMFVKASIAQGLEAGKLAIVERGSPDQHVLVASDAVALIRAVDPEAVRFYNG